MGCNDAINGMDFREPLCSSGQFVAAQNKPGSWGTTMYWAYRIGVDSVCALERCQCVRATNDDHWAMVDV
jgi:hypothetical protein